MPASCSHNTAVGAGIGVGATLRVAILVLFGDILLQNERSRNNVPRQSRDDITGKDAQRVVERRQSPEGHGPPLPSQMLDSTSFRPELKASGSFRV